MSSSVRFLPPSNPSNGGSVIGGIGNNPTSVSIGGAPARFYPPQGTTVAPGGTQDVLVGDASAMVNQGWVQCGQVGTTAQRPAVGVTDAGKIYLDTSLALVIIWDGLTWRNPLTGASV